jgi:hypothetical protein
MTNVLYIHGQELVLNATTASTCQANAVSLSARTPSAALVSTFGAGATNVLSVTTLATQDAVSKDVANNQT